MSLKIQIIAIFLAFVMSSISGCKSEEEQEPPEKQNVEVEQADHLTIFLGPDLRERVKIGKPFFTRVSEKLHVPGQVKVNETKLVQVGASFTGRIVEIYAHLGDSIAAGDKLARITSPKLVQAQLAYLRANSLAVLAERAAIRARQLFAEDVISAAELQRRESESQVSNAELSAARDQLLLLGVNSRAVQDLTKRGQILPSVEIIAPTSGTVIERNVALGQVVQPSDQLFTLADLSVLWVVGDVPEHAAYFVEQGQHVEIRVPALDGKSVDGTIIFVADIVNPLTRTVMVRTEVENPERKLKPDMLATVHIDGHAHERLVIPEGAVVREHNEDHVFILQENGGFTLALVELDGTINQMRPVISGVTADQSIIVKGAFHVNNERKRAHLE
ncbi:efflux RND transporter periplasmic adaptor subunit [Nitrosomonas sp. HPC101]|uniref:efflux RND transporter periplasmic adaptor subunit n=1 Tax=Nitrosomonas sp. HPC101 TaxID=1658667 RepID=UPI00136B049B|nr:efflux RND transporter periplasmic adaptor subunit [Nitrosomonas sp. HPC101]MXS85170.1 efflux RND transporter periplasmic adaptor subunit [Nitrosomonas sp. HPC101]